MTEGDTERIKVEEWHCRGCGWTEPQYQEGDPALCGNCGVEYVQKTPTRVRNWPRCNGWNEDGSKCDRETSSEYCHDHKPEPAYEPETLEMEAPVYLVDMSGSGMPDILFPEDDYVGAFQYATGELPEDVEDEHDEEWRISTIDWDGLKEVPIADV